MMVNYYFTRKIRMVLLSLLIILNFIIRIPSIPHEKGIDSFFLHSLANSISLFGEARWWINELSVFGLYPYSYASSVPFSLSGTSQLMNISMEHSILLYCVFLGLFSMFTMYALAGALCNNFMFKYILSMFFSISQGVLLYTTWEISGRGIFIIFLPLFIYLLLNYVNYKFKSLIMLSILFMFLFSTHHFTYFTIVFLFAYGFLMFLKKINIKFTSKKLLYIYSIIFITVFLLPFFSRLFMLYGSRYGWILDISVSTIRWVGPLIFFAISGFAYLYYKDEKTLNEWFLLISILLFIPMMYSPQYGKFLILPLLIIFMGISFMNLFNFVTVRNKNSKIIIYFVLLMLLFVSFSSFFNHERLSSSKNYWFMSDETYVGGLWAKEYIREYSNAFGTGIRMQRLTSMSDGHLTIPTQYAADLAYGFINRSDIQMSQVSPFSKDFYFEGPYVVQQGNSLTGAMSWIHQQRNINDKKIIGMFKMYKINYILDDKLSYGNVMSSVYNTKNKIFDSNNIGIYLV